STDAPLKTSDVLDGAAQQLILAQSEKDEQPLPDGMQRIEKDTASSDPEIQNDDEGNLRGIPEILVKGSRGKFSLNADVERTRDDVQPYVVLGREKIEQSGASTVDELLKQQLSMNYSPNTSNQTTGLGVGNESAIALRGLDSRQTLI